MKFCVKNLPDSLLNGLALLQNDYGFSFDPDGLQLIAVQTTDRILKVERNQNRVVIQYHLPIHFFRGISLLLQQIISSQNFCVVEPTAFDSIGIMLDVSQSGALPRIDTLSELMRRMAMMGLNRLILYMEDSYLIPDKPFWGYFLGKYNQKDLCAIDNYADCLGIEVVPAIQTLSHLADVLKWSAFSEVRENDATLLPGESKTEELICKMFTSLNGCFRSRKIHIGMDEAWGLGEGAYRLQHGGKIVPKEKIMQRHLSVVTRIAERFGLQPMIWSDMFFRGDYQSDSIYGNDFYLHTKITQEMVDTFPKQTQMVFWEYNSVDPDFYRRAIEQHCLFGSPPVFAGAIWNWTGFGVNYGLTQKSTNAAMTACKQTGIKEVFATLWGDDNTECPWFASLAGLQLFAEHGYQENTPDIRKLTQRFAVCCNANYADFMRIQYLDEIPGISSGNLDMANPSKFLLWQNVLRGLLDRNVEGLGLSQYYQNLSSQFHESIERNPWNRSLFLLYESLCMVLAIKADMGNRLYWAYQQKDRQQLKFCLEDLEKLNDRCIYLKNLHRSIWYGENHGSGWEIIGLRYGNLIESVQTAIFRLKQYDSGEIDCLEELEEPRQFFDGSSKIPSVYSYRWMPSASRLFLN